MVHLALYQPDIPQNLGSAMRLSACLGRKLEVIEPCGFPWNEKKIRQSGMDYVDAVEIVKHSSWEKFYASHKDVIDRPASRIVLMTTKASIPYTDFQFTPHDIILAGRESAGVPDEIHNIVDHRIVIPVQQGLRSFNIINASAMIMGEALRQTKEFPT